MEEMKKEVDQYITKRYNRWLDYAKYHCTLAEMEDEAADVLHEVLCMLLEKEYSQLQTLLHSKRGGYTDLDYYILQMMKLNITSESSPYRYKYKTIPIDENTNWQHVDLIDEPDNEIDYAGETLQKIQLVREIVSQLKISRKTRQIFHYRFFLGEAFINWPGSETQKQLYKSYHRVVRLIRKALNHKEEKGIKED